MRVKRGNAYIDDAVDIKINRRQPGRKFFANYTHGLRLAIDLPGPGKREFVGLLCLNTTAS